MNILVLIAQFWTTVWPVGYASETPSEIAQGFFEATLVMPIVILFYVAFKIIKKTKFKALKDNDITS
jgi:yeast amino acid transporter